MHIFKRLAWAFLIYTGISMFFAIVIYSSSSGLEESQGTFLMVLAVALLCIFNFLLSLTALLNLIQPLRENRYFSALSFFGLPFALLLYIIILYFKSRIEGGNVTLFCMFFVLHCCVWACSLITSINSGEA